MVARVAAAVAEHDSARRHTCHNYEEATSRNIGWLTEWEQQSLRRKKVAIAGMGGVGGIHLQTLARLGIGAFHIADMDDFEVANFNRQVGATMRTIGQAKAAVMAATAADINPEASITTFDAGIDGSNIDAFLEEVDLFIDGFDFFVLDIRARVFARAAERGIPAITAAPLGMGTAYLIFMPGKMTFEEYFRLEGLPEVRQYVNFFVGLSPWALHRPYLIDPTRIDLANRRGPSTAMGCQLAAGVVGAEAVKILLGRGPLRAAPWVHHFDAFRHKHLSKRLPGGNRHPLQAIKCRLAYKGFDRLSRMAEQRRGCEGTPSEQQTEVEKILDLARWAPSGDNNQPWRFEITGADSLKVHVRDLADHDVYDYNNGQPTLLSTGMLLESMRLAATRFGRNLIWQHESSLAHRHVIVVELPRDKTIAEDPLTPFIPIRSVDRHPYKTTPLTPEQKRTLESALGNHLVITWHESWPERRRMAGINALATDIRLRIPEAYRVHQEILDWERDYSPDRVPVNTLGLDPLTLKLMRWAMGEWRRMERLNRLPGATVGTQLQMDILPGLLSAAHFTIAWKVQPATENRFSALLRAGAALQRFWLTATRLGLAMQPTMATIIFAHYGREDIPFTTEGEIRQRARSLDHRLSTHSRQQNTAMVFKGRIGKSRKRSLKSRSTRQSVKTLTVSE